MVSCICAATAALLTLFSAQKIEGLEDMLRPCSPLPARRVAAGLRAGSCTQASAAPAQQPLLARAAHVTPLAHACTQSAEAAAPGLGGFTPEQARHEVRS